MNIYQIAYYLGYRKEDKIYPLGPFNEKGKLKPILLRTYDTLHSFDCEKVEVTDSEFSEVLYKEFECDGDKRKNKRYHVPLKICRKGVLSAEVFFQSMKLMTTKNLMEPSVVSTISRHLQSMQNC